MCLQINILKVLSDLACKITSIVSGEALLVILSFFIYFIFLKKAKNTKIDVKDIIYGHLKTLKNYQTGKYSIKDVLTFFIFPLIISILLTMKSVVSKEGIQIILTVFSIFAGLLFNFLLLIMDIGRRVKQQGATATVDAKKQKATEALIKETYCNVSFSILVSLFIVCFSLIFVVGITNVVIKCIVSIVLYWLIFVFIMTLFMILKRIFRLLNNEFN